MSFALSHHLESQVLFAAILDSSGPGPNLPVARLQLPTKLESAWQEREGLKSLGRALWVVWAAQGPPELSLGCVRWTEGKKAGKGMCGLS